jgi:hypothetical protein
MRFSADKINELIREILQQWTTFFFFEKTTRFNEKRYLGFKPHSS